MATCQISLCFYAPKQQALTSCTIHPNAILHSRVIRPMTSTIYAQSTQTTSTVSCVICSNDINCFMRNLLKRNRRGGACVPARTSAQRRFHTKKGLCITHHTRGIERWMRPCRATRAGTQAPPLPNSTKPRGVALPRSGYTFDSAGLASVTQPTLGNDASEEATPLWVVLFLIAHHYHTRRMDYS